MVIIAKDNVSTESINADTEVYQSVEMMQKPADADDEYDSDTVVVAKPFAKRNIAVEETAATEAEPTAVLTEQSADVEDGGDGEKNTAEVADLLQSANLSQASSGGYNRSSVTGTARPWEL